MLQLNPLLTDASVLIIVPNTFIFSSLIVPYLFAFRVDLDGILMTVNEFAGAW